MAIESILKNRNWTLCFSFYKRKCYLTGESLKFKWAYRGRKKIWYPIMCGGSSINDDVWISQAEYLNLLIKDKL